MIRRKPLVMGNWKCHGRLAENAARLAAIVDAAKATDKVELVVCPVSVHLQSAAEQLKGQVVALGAQNVSPYDDGAYTGEVSADMLAELGVRFVIVGHSERRGLFAEGNDLIAAKVLRVLSADMTPVICVGETLEQREKGQTLDVVLGQLQAVADSLPAVEDWRRTVVAYEPVWAIGTGRSATADQAQEVHGAIRAWLRQQGGSQADEVRILYGGSMKPGNADELLRQKDIDGGLIGGASLDAESFVAIYHAAIKAAEQ
jgi:triosephosphate isomerase